MLALLALWWSQVDIFGRRLPVALFLYPSYSGGCLRFRLLTAVYCAHQDLRTLLARVASYILMANWCSSWKLPVAGSPPFFSLLTLVDLDGAWRSAVHMSTGDRTGGLLPQRDDFCGHLAARLRPDDPRTAGLCRASCCPCRWPGMRSSSCLSVALFLLSGYSLGCGLIRGFNRQVPRQGPLPPKLATSLVRLAPDVACRA